MFALVVACVIMWLLCGWRGRDVWWDFVDCGVCLAYSCLSLLFWLLWVWPAGVSVLFCGCWML